MKVSNKPNLALPMFNPNTESEEIARDQARARARYEEHAARIRNDTSEAPLTESVGDRIWRLLRQSMT